MVNPQAGSSICLGIEVNKENGLPPRRKAGSKIDGGGSFADPAFLIDNRNYISH